MIWWACFDCGSHRVCAHRERELLDWMRQFVDEGAVAAAEPVTREGIIAARAAAPEPFVAVTEFPHVERRREYLRATGRSDERLPAAPPRRPPMPIRRHETQRRAAGGLRGW